MTDQPTEPDVRAVALFILNADQRDMNVIHQAFRARQNVLREEKKLEMMANIYVGSRVMLNANVSPKMLEWKYATVEKITEDRFLVRLEDPPSSKWRGLVGVQISQIELL